MKVRLTLQISKRIKARGLQWAPFKPLVTRAGDLPHTCTVPFGTTRCHRLRADGDRAVTLRITAYTHSALSPNCHRHRLREAGRGTDDHDQHR